MFAIEIELYITTLFIPSSSYLVNKYIVVHTFIRHGTSYHRDFTIKLNKLTTAVVAVRANDGLCSIFARSNCTLVGDGTQHHTSRSMDDCFTTVAG